MAFILDATIGGTASNSYASRQEIIDIADGNINGELFTNLSTTDQDKYISTASLRLDTLDYYGIAVTTIQNLAFPRSGILKGSGIAYANDEIPSNLKRAVFELILFWLKSDERMISDIELHDAGMIETYSVGPLNYKFRANAKSDSLPETVKRELKAMGSVWISDSTTLPKFLSL